MTYSHTREDIEKALQDLIAMPSLRSAQQRLRRFIDQAFRVSAELEEVYANSVDKADAWDKVIDDRGNLTADKEALQNETDRLVKELAAARNAPLPDFVPVNLNHLCKFKLFESGLKLLNDRGIKPTVDPEGYVTMQIHDFASTFGSSFSGCYSPIETEVLFATRDFATRNPYFPAEVKQQPESILPDEMPPFNFTFEHKGNGA